MYLDKDGNVIKGLTTSGWLAVGVPGIVSGLEYISAEIWNDDAQSADRAGDQTGRGRIYPGSGRRRQARRCDRGFQKNFRRPPPFFSTRDSLSSPAKGWCSPISPTRCVRSAEHGADGFYKGKTGAAIVKASRAGGGIIAQEDLDRYRTREFAPVECDYRGYHVISAPPPSSGGVAICEMLNILEAYPLRELGWGSAQALHYEIEAMRHAFADRSGLVGDPDFVATPVKKLIDKDYAASIRDTIKPDRAGVSSEIKQGQRRTKAATPRISPSSTMPAMQFR